MMNKRATISDCGNYRYTLERQWDSKKPTLGFMMLNPSTADAEKDDPTIRRCIGFGKELGMGGIIVLNVFAYRATDPKELLSAADPVGPLNSNHLKWYGNQASYVIAAWGANKTVTAGRVAEITRVIPVLHCLGTTKDGSPRHPLYVKAWTRPVPWHGEFQDSVTYRNGSIL